MHIQDISSLSNFLFKKAPNTSGGNTPHQSTPQWLITWILEEKKIPIFENSVIESLGKISFVQTGSNSPKS